MVFLTSPLQTDHVRTQKWETRISSPRWCAVSRGMVCCEQGDGVLWAGGWCAVSRGMVCCEQGGGVLWAGGCCARTDDHTLHAVTFSRMFPIPFTLSSMYAVHVAWCLLYDVTWCTTLAVCCECCLVYYARCLLRMLPGVLRSLSAANVSWCTTLAVYSMVLLWMLPGVLYCLLTGHVAWCLLTGHVAWCTMPSSKWSYWMVRCKEVIWIGLYYIKRYFFSRWLIQ
jgi:hypothetical protein